MKIKAVIASIALTMILSGCGEAVSTMPSSSEVTTTVPATTVEATEAATKAEEKTDVKIIGTEKTGDSVFKVELTNNTGKDITAFSVKTDSETEYPDNMLAKSEIFKKDEKRILFYEKGKSSVQEDDDAPVISTEYTIKLTFSDNTEAVLHNFPFGDIVKGSIESEDDICFLKYDSKRSGDTISTKEAEEMTEIISPEPDYTPQATEAPYEEVQNDNNYTPDNNNNNNTYSEPDQPAAQTPAETPAPEPTQAPEPVAPEPTAAEDPNAGCLQGGLFY